MIIDKVRDKSVPRFLIYDIIRFEVRQHNMTPDIKSH